MSENSDIVGVIEVLKRIIFLYDSAGAKAAVTRPQFELDEYFAF